MVGVFFGTQEELAALEVLGVERFAYRVNRKLKRWDYELMIISRLLIYGSVDDERESIASDLYFLIATKDESCLV